MFSDIYKIREDPKGMFYEVEGKVRTVPGLYGDWEGEGRGVAIEAAL